MPDFRMPSLGADMETGTLLEWRVKPGDAVRRGDIIALIDTDKAEVEVEIFADGIVEEILVAPGTKVPVGTLLARLRGPDGTTAPTPPGVHPPAPAPPLAAPPAQAPPPPPAPAGPRHHASPLARRVAAELGVDLASVQGTGEGGAITRADVERASAAALGAVSAPAPAVRAAERALAMRKTIAAAMTRSKREIPHYYLATRIDLAPALRWIGAENLRRPVPERLLPAALLLKATALALREVPELNGSFVGGAFLPGEAIHIGVAVSLRPAGLVAPALHHADRMPLVELMTSLRDLVRRARSGVLRSSELSDATVTVSNLGDQGVDAVFGVIHPPQVAIVGFGRVREEAWAEAGRVEGRPTVTVTLAGDHRASDGHRGGLFLAALDRLLRSPESL